MNLQRNYHFRLWDYTRGFPFNSCGLRICPVFLSLMKRLTNVSKRNLPFPSKSTVQNVLNKGKSKVVFFLQKTGGSDCILVSVSGRRRLSPQTRDVLQVSGQGRWTRGPPTCLTLHRYLSVGNLTVEDRCDLRGCGRSGGPSEAGSHDVYGR